MVVTLFGTKTLLEPMMVCAFLELIPHWGPVFGRAIVITDSLLRNDTKPLPELMSYQRWDSQDMNTS